MDAESEVVMFFDRYAVKAELFQELPTADLHAAAQTLRPIHAEQSALLAQANDGKESSEQVSEVGHEVSVNALSRIYRTVTAALSKAARSRRAEAASASRERLEGTSQKARRELFKRLKRAEKLPQVLLKDPATNGLTTSAPRIAEILRHEWAPIFNRHEGKLPSWEDFVQAYDDGSENSPLQHHLHCPKAVPSGQQLYDAA